MSTRYVYDVYNVSGIETTRVNEFFEYTWSDYPSYRAHACKSYRGSSAKNRDGKTIAVYEPVDESETELGPFSENYYTFDTSVYPYLIIEQYSKASGTKLVGFCCLLQWVQGASYAYWHVKTTRNSLDIRNLSNYNHHDSWQGYLDEYFGKFDQTGGEIEKGTTLLRTEYTTQSGLSGAYYSGGWKWRVYKGSDSIDPLSVSCLQNTLYGGEPVTVQVEARTPTYGGTISYQYQYSVDGGKTWTNAGSKTTNTSLEIVLPAEAQQFQARVLASDNYGFTSATYVYSPALEVSQLKAYVGVNGKARPVVKIYVGVDGKAREVVKGYVGINGKARKFL